MNVGLYLFLTFLVVMILVNNSEEKHEIRKDMASKIKKPDLDKKHQASSREIRYMFRESMNEINKEYDRFYKQNKEY